MNDLKQVRLVLFFTRGMSLEAWERGGIFEREVALYRSLRPYLGGITFITYGNRRDLEFLPRLEGIDIVCNQWNLSLPWYRRFLSFFPGAWKRGQVVFKSNQIRGSDWPLYFANRWNKPFIARGGYLFSSDMCWRFGRDAPETREAATLEKRIFHGAHRIVVTTEKSRSDVVADYEMDASRVRVIPNYVNTQLFCPQPQVKRHPRRLIFVGRLEPVKNLFEVLLALVGLDVELWMVGNGTLRESLEQKAKELELSVRFLGILPHVQLPSILNSASVYIQISHWEGNPKTILEAMSCGLPVIVSDIAGIRGSVQHGENGYLCGLTHPSIRQAVVEVLDNAPMRDRLGRNARIYAEANLSLERVVELEREVIAEAIQQNANVMTRHGLL